MKLYYIQVVDVFEQHNITFYLVGVWFLLAYEQCGFGFDLRLGYNNYLSTLISISFSHHAKSKYCS